ncbi:anaphase spindle elongation protein 1-like [Drosophila hydei]|uniref:Anaphase spindle elongation protein 1-like n=1 Tax=Drosophila hydei TaxID=7224 RepID=A0A6J1LV29_DROHY|nr:anaphase spindle elongation protein 1-like [Drosophila hydei]
MGDADHNKISVDTLCEVWEEMQRTFEMDIRVLLDKAKELAMELSKAVESSAEPVGRLRSQQQFKLNYLMIHLTEELQRRSDKACAKRRLQEWNKSLDKMRNKLASLSQSLSKLGLIDVLAMQELCELPDNSTHNYELLSQAVQRCEEIRTANLSVLIDQVHTEINEWCDLTLQYPSVRNYQKDCCTEELLDLLEEQLKEIKNYYNSNKSIFEMYAKRVKLWTRMEALEEKAKKPNRYHNRGGALLREERERKTISIKLPKIEQQLRELVQAYEQGNGRPFLVQGEEVLGRIANEWEDYRMAKEQKTAARKKAASDTILEPLNSTFSSLISLRKTTSVPYFNSSIGSVGTRPA